MEEEITQETGGKTLLCVCVSMYVDMHMCSVSTLLCVFAYVVFTCAHLSVCERFTVVKLHALTAYVPASVPGAF